jgi:arylsulfatase A-like enzyme
MRFRQLYYSAITLVDKNMAKVLDALEETGQLDNTLIIMCSDHGDMLGDNGAYDKSVPNEQSVRVPFVIRYPRAFTPGTTRSDMVDLVDILPTVLDVCVIPLPSGIDWPGESLCVPEGCGVKDRSVHYAENGRGAGRFISLRGTRYKYNYWFCQGREELYDLQNDPHETDNLLKYDPCDETKAVHHRMRRQLTAYERRYGHPDSIADGELAVFEGVPTETWPPCLYGLDWQLAMHPFNMSAEEAAKLNTHGEEFRAAVAQEPTVEMDRINWEFYESATRDYETRKEVANR